MLGKGRIKQAVGSVKASPCFAVALLKKGQLVVINGYIKPEEWQTAQGEKRSRITFVCTSIASPTESLGSAKNPTTDKASAKATEPVAVAEPVTEEVPF